jgi:hypothetical protein
MPEREEIVLDISTGVNDTAKANKDLASVERQAQKTAETVIRVSDRSRNSLERLVASVEKQAQAYGKTGVDRLIAQRDQLIQRLGGEEKAIARVRAAYDRMIAVEKQAAASSQSFAGRVRSFVQAPLQSAGEAAEGFVGKIGKVGGIAAGVAVGVGVLAKAAFSLVANLGSAAEQMTNMSDRTGLSLNQLDKLQAMSKVAGVNIGALESNTRILVQRLTQEGTESDRARASLQKLGVVTHELNGAQREAGPILMDVMKRLGGVQSSTERVKIAQELFGRGAMELLPLIKNYKELETEVERLGFGMDEYLLKRLGAGADEIDKLGLRWDLLKRKLAVPALGIVNIVTRVVDAMSGGEWQPKQVPTAGGKLTPALAATHGGEKYTGDLVTRLREAADKGAGALASREFRASRRSTPEGMKARLEEIKGERDPILGALLSGDLGKTAFDAQRAALNVLDREAAGIQKQLDAIEAAAKKAKDLAAKAEESRKLLDMYRKRVAAAAMGVDQQIVAPDKTLPEKYSMEYRADRFREGLARQIEQDEETLRQLERTKAHFEQLDDEAIEARETQAKKYAEIAEHEFNRVRGAFEGLFDAAFAGARNFWDAMRRFAYTLFLTPIKEALSGMFAQMMTGTRMVNGAAVPGGSSLGGLFGGILSGGMSTAQATTGGPGGTGGFAGRVGGLGGFGGGILSGGGLTAAGLAPGVLAGAGMGLMGAYKLGGSGSPLRYGAPALGAVSGLLGFGALTAMFPSLLMAGPWGWAAAAGIGATIGMIGLFRKSAEEKAREKIRAIYQVNIADKGILRQIVETARQGFGGNLDVAIRSPQIRELIELYAMTTGQSASGMPAQMRAASLVQSGGSLYQLPSWSSGSMLPSPGGLPTFGAAPQSQTIVINMDGKQIGQGVIQNGRVIVQGAVKALAGSSGRRELVNTQFSLGTVSA